MSHNSITTQRTPHRSARHLLPLLFVCVMFFPTMLPAQVLTSMGTDFWVAIMPCWLDNDVDSYYLSASGPRSCNITVANPNTGWSHTFALSAGSITTYQLPNAHSWQAGSCVVNNMGLHVTSTDSVQLWVDIISQSPASCDASHLLPTTVLGSDYIVQTTDVSNSHTSESRAQFSVLAIEDSTTVDIVLSSPTSTDLPAGTTLTRTLHAGQVFQVQGPRQSGDFSGTSVRARNCKKIAVFSGASSTNMPFSNTTSADLTYQQNLPIGALGTEWLLTPSAWHDTSDYVRITSPYNNCQIYRNSTLLATIDSHQSYQFKLNAPAHIVTSQPVALYQYLDSRHSSGTGSDWGDVAMFAPNTIHQTTQSCTFPCFQVRNRNPYSSKYYVNILVPTAEIALLRLDGSSPVSGFLPILGTPYSYVRKSINHGAHTLTTTGSGFSAYTYGLGENWEAYAMSLGGTDPGILLTMTGRVDITIDTGNCSGSLWWRDTLLVAPSTTQWLSTNTSNGCDSLFTINLSTYPSYSDTLNWAACHDTILWGDTLLSVPGTHTLHYQSAAGCDSMLHLTLTALPHYKLFDTVYIWANDTYTDHQGQQHLVGQEYEDTLLTIMGCDSILHVTVMPYQDTTCTHHLWIPNVFTPSHESNSLFRIPHENITQMEVNIYQRWGEWICTFDGLTQGWDGTQTGIPCKQGTYVYLIRYKTPCLLNPKPIVGTITILR